MKVLVLIHEAFGARGGIGKFNSDLLKALCLYPRLTEVVALPRNLTQVPAHLPENLHYLTDGAGSVVAYLATLARLLMTSRRFDLVICGHINLLPAALLCRLRGSAPILLVLHGIDAWQPSTHRLANRAARRVDCFIAVSETTKRRFLAWAKLPEDRGFILPNCVDLKQFRPGPRKKELIERYGLEGRTVMMTLARLDSRERYKGIDEILDILPELAAKVPDLVYLVAGDGADRPRLEAKVKSLDLERHTAFTGYVAEAEKADHYRLADVFVLAGRKEGFGIVLLEAMACGVPAVASRLDGSKEAVLNGALGEVVDPTDRADLQAGILAALQRPAGAPPEGLAHFSYPNFETRLHEILDLALPTPVGARVRDSACGR